MRSGLGRTGASAQREAHREARAGAGARLHLAPPAVLRDDALADREPEARPAPRGLGGVEGLEDARDLLGADPGAVVADLDPHALALPAGGNPHPAAAPLERFGRVLEQVEENLVQRARVAL